MSASALPPGGGRAFGPGSHAKVEFGQSDDFAVFEHALPPAWPGTPLHLHRAYDEAFYVIEGSVEFSLDGTRTDCPAGTFVFVPHGSTHGFGNPALAPARLLVITSPGAIRLVEGVYRLMDKEGPPDREALVALFADHQSEIVTPDV
jgi:mannose-6-phosphate isomerase-like protein (cupin superfamily)